MFLVLKSKLFDDSLIIAIKKLIPCFVSPVFQSVAYSGKWEPAHTDQLTSAHTLLYAQSHLDVFFYFVTFSSYQCFSMHSSLLHFFVIFFQKLANMKTKQIKSFQCFDFSCFWWLSWCASIFIAKSFDHTISSRWKSLNKLNKQSKTISFVKINQSFCPSYELKKITLSQ